MLSKTQPVKPHFPQQKPPNKHISPMAVCVCVCVCVSIELSYNLFLTNINLKF